MSSMWDDRRMRARWWCALPTVIVGLISAASVTALSTATQVRPWEDRGLGADRRAQLLVATMTLDEKTALLYGYGAKRVGPDRWQVYVKGNDRLGIPDMTQGDSPSGILVGSDAVIQMPASIGLAATWSLDDARAYGDVMGGEARALGYGVLQGPNVDIARDPRHGRAYDTLGEDPHLIGRLATEYVRAVQAHRVIASAKHFVANTIETDRTKLDVRVHERTLHELYLAPFRDLVRHADVGMVMCAYNMVNGVPVCDAADLIRQLLREQWGFTGIVRTDAGAAHTVASIVDGVDQEFRGELHFGKELIAAVRSGEIPDAAVDSAVRDILRTMIAHGIFDDPPRRTSVDVPADAVRARRVAEDSIVLLRNRHRMLPLDSARLHSIVVIGPDANDTLTAGGPAHRAPLGKDTIVEALRQRLPNVSVDYAPGVDPISPVAELPGFPQLPSSIMTAADGSSGTTAKYLDAEGRVLVSRVDTCTCFSTASMFVDSVAVHPPAPQQVASIDWSGRISIPTSGTYGFDFVTPDAAKLEIDGRLVLDAETTHALTRKAARLQLSAGKHDFRVAYRLGTAKGEREPVGHSHVLKVGWLAPPGVYEPSIAAAARRAAAADIALVVVRDLESETLDRVNLTLPNDQDRLIEAVARANPRTVVALTTGSAVLMPWSSRVPAILEAWYGGTAAGAALSSVLFGDADASGRLPISFPASLADLPTALATQFPGVNGVARFTEGLRVGYRHYGAPHGPRAAYPFGFGLSYTAFAYGQLLLTRHQIPAIDVPETTSEETPAVVVNVRVSNRGDRAGVAVPQVYIRFPSTATEPAAILKGFERIQLGPGKSALISLPLRTRDFAVYVPSERRWKVQPGVYRVCVGTSSTALLLCGDVTAHSAASAAR